MTCLFFLPIFFCHFSFIHINYLLLLIKFIFLLKTNTESYFQIFYLNFHHVNGVFNYSSFKKLCLSVFIYMLGIKHPNRYSLVPMAFIDWLSTLLPRKKIIKFYSFLGSLFCQSIFLLSPVHVVSIIAI